MLAVAQVSRCLNWNLGFQGLPELSSMLSVLSAELGTSDSRGSGPGWVSVLRAPAESLLQARAQIPKFRVCGLRIGSEIIFSPQAMLLLSAPETKKASQPTMQPLALKN